MAPRPADGPAQQPRRGDRATVAELQDLWQGCESQMRAIFERLAAENEALRAQLDASREAAGARPLPVMPPSAEEDSGDESGDVDDDVGLELAPLDLDVTYLDGARCCDKSDVDVLSDRVEEMSTQVPGPRHSELTPPSKEDEERGRGSRTSMTSVVSLTSHSDLPPLSRLVRSLAFESVINTCILANCVTVGMWAHQLVTGQFDSKTVFVTDLLEHVFVAIFVIELVLKVRVHGWASYSPSSPATRANFIDMMLVIVTGVFFTWLLPLCALIFGFDSEAGPFKTLTVLRTVRLARLVRVMQRSPVFREAWMLIRGLGDSSRTLFWTCNVVFLVTYVFAIVGLATLVVELQAQRETRSDPADIAALDELLHMLGGLDRLMAALVQILLGDSFHAFTREAQRFVWWSWAYFYAYISIAVVVLMNLVTAIIVENAMETSRADHEHVASEKEAKRKKDIHRLRKLFRSLDTDESGTLSWDEFKDSFHDPEMTRHWTVLDFQQEDCAELFRLLDDGDGEITTHEFMEALSRMSGTAQSKDVFRIQKTLERVQTSLEAVVARQRALEDHEALEPY